MSIPMSEKAKGKQRARLDDVSDEAVLRNRPITIRFTEGVPDLVLRIEEKETVRNIKRHMREYRPTLRTRRLRLIHAGRLLTDGITLYDWLASLEERQRRAAPSDITTEIREALGDTEVKAKGKEKDGDEMVWLHCSIGAEFAEQEEGEGDERIQTTQITPLRGFDRLVTAGFSPADIENARQQFHLSRQARSSEDREGNDEEEHARALEEQWIDEMDNPAAAAAGLLDGIDGGSSEAIYTTTLQGLLTGFFFPLLPFYFMRTPPPPSLFTERPLQPDSPLPETVTSAVFTRRMQVAVMLGLVANISYAILRMFH